MFIFFFHFVCKLLVCIRMTYFRDFITFPSCWIFYHMALWRIYFLGSASFRGRSKAPFWEDEFEKFSNCWLFFPAYSSKNSIQKCNFFILEEEFSPRSASDLDLKEWFITQTKFLSWLMLAELMSYQLYINWKIYLIENIDRWWYKLQKMK